MRATGRNGNYSNPWWFYQPGQIAERQLRWREEDADDMDIFPEEDYCEGDFFREEFGEEFGEDFDRNFYASDDQRLPVVEPFVRQIRKVGCNDPCPFGSGKKFKKCCLH